LSHKPVFVEKPLAIRREELEEVQHAYREEEKSNQNAL